MTAQTKVNRPAWALSDLPRVRLASLPTPLERGPVLPGGARLWIKRDDLTGLGLGGNKVRKLEFLCAAARQQNADMLVTVGAAQSNHCRLTAAAARVLGLECHLFLGGRQASPPCGNQLLMDLFAAQLHFPGTDSWDELEAIMEEKVAAWQRQGRRPYMMPIGGSTGVGACGYAAAWVELLQQCERANVAPAAIMHATSSGGTHAGLLAGRHATGGGPSILATAVAKTAGSLRDETFSIARQCLELLGVSSDMSRDGIQVDDSQQGPGYAVPTAEADEAIFWAARHAGLVLDRVYTGKAFATLLQMARSGGFMQGQDVLFIHTGGWPALFASNGYPSATQPTI